MSNKNILKWTIQRRFDSISRRVKFEIREIRRVYKHVSTGDVVSLMLASSVMIGIFIYIGILNAKFN